MGRKKRNAPKSGCAGPLPCPFRKNCFIATISDFISGPNNIRIEKMAVELVFNAKTTQDKYECLKGFPAEDVKMIIRKVEEWNTRAEKDCYVFPRLFEVANSLTYDDSKPELVEQALDLCISGRKAPDIVQSFFSDSLGAPWRIPRTLPGASNINGLLEASMAAQKDKLPGTEFDQCYLSGDCLAVCGMLHTYLKQCGINSEFNTGILRVGDKGLPMVWLTIHGTLIDNTYHHWPDDDAEDLSEQMLRLKRVEN